MSEKSLKKSIEAGNSALYIVRGARYILPLATLAFYALMKLGVENVALLKLERNSFDERSRSQSFFFHDEYLRKEYPRVLALIQERNVTTSPALLTVKRKITRADFKKAKFRGHNVALPSDDELMSPAQQIESVPEVITLANGTEHLQQCEPIEEWQTTFYPTCNILHELSVYEENVRYIAKGHIRSVWKASASQNGKNATKYDEEEVILKTLNLNVERGDVNFDPHRYESHRRDAVISERLTSSPHIVDIYGFCGHSCLNEPMKGFLPHKKRGTSLEKLELALDAVKALVDLHGVGDGTTERKGVVAIVHKDLTEYNFLRSRNGTIKLNDFNIARFPEWDETTKTACKFSKPDCGGTHKAPEECLGKPLTEKIDIYSFGLILNYILTGLKPYKSPRLKKSEIHKHIMAGKPPVVEERIRNSSDIATQTILRLMSECYQFDPAARPTAKEIELVLSEAISLVKKDK